jgi:membrane-associated phospholipid phosphatase
MTTAAYTVTSLWLLPDRPALELAASPEPLGFDAGVAGKPEGEGAVPLASDAFSYGGTFLGLVAAPIYGALDIGPDGARGGGRGALTHGVIFAESVTVSVTLTDIVKSASRRPRPYTRTPGFEWEEADDQMSFPSGHTSTSGALSFSLAHQIVRTQDLPLGGQLAAYGLATAYTATTGVLRVAAAKHYPSDVVVGGLLGATIGVVVPELHRGTGLRVSATAGTGTPGVALSGRL